MTRRLVLLALLASALAPARAAAQAIPVGTGGDVSSLVGIPLDVPFVVDMSARAERLGAFAMRIRWNPAVLRFDGGTPGSFGSTTINADSLAQGIIRLTGANPQGVTGLVTVALARFTPLVADTMTIGITLSELFAATIFTDLLPAAAVTSGLFCPARGRYGDIDGDGNVNSRDALLALSHAVGLSTAPYDITLGDVDGNGQTTARDALIILSAAVGLDVSGTRVWGVAGGACTTGALATLMIAPGATGDLMPGEQVQLELRALAGGTLQTVTNAAWSTSDPNVVGVLVNGEITARSAGSAVIYAVKDGRDTAQLAVQVVARRSTHWVSADAISAVNQIGTSQLPYATLQQAEDAAQARDTVMVRPGRYGEGAAFHLPVVMIGLTAGGAGVVISGAAGDTVGLRLDGGGVSEVHNLSIEGFRVGLKLGSTVDTVVVDSLRVFARSYQSCATAIEGDDAWALIVRHSTLIGDGENGCTSGIDLNGNVRLVVVEDTRITDFGTEDTGIYGNNVDSMVVRRSDISDNGDYGINVNAYPYTGSRVPAAGSLALVIEDSRFEHNRYEAVNASGLRSALIARSFVDMRNQGYGALNLYGVDSAYVRLVRDSLLMDDNDWIDSYGFDSVIVDSIRVVGGDDGNFDGVDYLRVRHSSFTQSTFGPVLDLIPNRLPTATVEVDSVTASGSTSCTRCMDFVDASSARVTVNRVRVDNFSEGVDAYDSSVTVTNSVFTNGDYGINAYSSSSAPQRLLVRNVVFTDVDYAIESGDLRSVIESVTITRTYDGVDLYGAGLDTVRFNTIDAASSDGIRASDAPVYVANNVLTSMQDGGIQVSGPQPPGPGDSLIIVNNAVSCTPFAGDGIDAAYANSRIQGNTLTGGCQYGIFLYAGGYLPASVVRGNTVTLDPASVHNGIWVDYGVRARVVGNLVTGGGDNGTILVAGLDAVNRVPFALVDSNTVQNAVIWGIRAEYVDSIEIRGNLVEDVASPPGYGATRGGIGVGNIQYAARIAGNTVRRARSAGIAVDQLLCCFADTATVFVDSNAVSASDTAAVRLDEGVVWMRHNNIRNNLRDGVFFNTASSGHEFHGNAFKGNGGYAINNFGDASANTDGNWWGVDGAFPGDPGTDSVVGVADATPLSVEPANLPALAPPALRPAPSAVRMAGAQTPAAATTATRGPRPAPSVREPRAARPEPANPRARPMSAAEARERAARAAQSVLREQRRRALETAREAAEAARDSIRAAREAERDARRRRTP